jgi:hypothetical protein
MTENTQPKAETLLEQLHVLKDYLLDRSNRVGRHEDGAMAYENSARLLRNILKNQVEPEVDWGVQYLDGNDNLHEWWGFTSDPRLPRVINGVTYPPQIDDEGIIYVTDDPGWVKAVSKRPKRVQIAPWEPLEEVSKEISKEDKDKA